MQLNEQPTEERTYVDHQLHANTNPTLIWLSSISGRRFLCVMAMITIFGLIIIFSNFGNQILSNKDLRQWVQNYFQSYLLNYTQNTIN